VSTAHHENPTRRDFLYIATGAMGAVAVGSVVVPLVASMAPNAATLAASAPIEIDLTPIAEGQCVTFKWKGRPVFVRHRSEAEIKTAEEAPASDMKDPETDDERVPMRDGKPVKQWVVVLGACTHLGCVPNTNAGEYGGWFCPCHGSQFDTAGRIRKGPAARNLDKLPVQFLSDTLIRVG
jgi:ubiquinol-cytochrome c reductase iron-sulfur subunit